ncbi:MAG: 23S rRNA (uracil(1939)-C(5))-methyltransferase RlmD [Bacteroidota bacterium]
MANHPSKKTFKQVVIGNMVEGGRCIARVDNLVIFVAQVAPGDVVDLRIVRKKKGYIEAVPVYIHSTGHTRTQPICQHFGTCGGCQWQHVRYAEQLVAKERLVLEKLVYIGHLQTPHVAPILAANITEYYRNKLEFTFSNKRWLSTAEIAGHEQLDRRALGFHKPGSFDRVVDIKQCHLQPAPSNAIRAALAQFARENELSFYDLQQNSGLLRNLIIRITSTGEVMAIVQFGQAAPDMIKHVMHHLKTQFPQLTSLQYVVNEKKNETFYDLPVHLYHGRSHVIEQIDGLKFRIGPKSFFQTNTAQTEALYRRIRELADLGYSEVLYDLYTGVGSIAIYLARYVRHVVGIDITEEAIADAQGNAKLNNVDNTTFVSGAVEQLLDTQFLATYGKPHTVITDPPRAGMHPQVIKQLLHIAPEKIVYVSCNPATQARDIALLGAQYQLITAQPIDMFPHTSHVENIALLAKSPNKRS